MILTKEELRKEIEENKLVEGYINLDMQLQQVGIDLTVKSINRYVSDSAGAIDYDNSLRKIPQTTQIMGTSGCYTLDKGAYLVDFNEKINLSDNIYAAGLPRSTLLRCGCELISGVWDPGYSGYGQALLVVCHKTSMYENARIYQLMFFRCAPTERYSGIYNQQRTWRR